MEEWQETGWENGSGMPFIQDLFGILRDIFIYIYIHSLDFVGNLSGRFMGYKQELNMNNRSHESQDKDYTDCLVDMTYPVFMCIYI